LLLLLEKNKTKNPCLNHGEKTVVTIKSNRLELTYPRRAGLIFMVLWYLQYKQKKYLAGTIKDTNYLQNFLSTI
jgi:hypothetical protein